MVKIADVTQNVHGGEFETVIKPQLFDGLLSNSNIIYILKKGGFGGGYADG